MSDAPTAANAGLSSCHICLKLAGADLHHCPRCGSALHKRKTESLQRTLALLVTAIGIGGLLAYDVAQRRREIGIRVALGARQHDVLRLVAAGALRLVMAGALLGVAGALLLGRSMAALLFRTSPADPVSLAAAVALLATVAVLACLVPARRASRVDPSIALRDG